MKKFIFLFLFSWLGLSANPTEYWHLKPYAKESLEGETYNLYEATFLSFQDLRLQLSIKSQEQESLLAWINVKKPIDFSFGKRAILYVNKLNPHKGYIEWEATKISCEMQWEAPAKENFDWESVPSLLNDLFIISEQSYSVYKGSIARNDYIYGQTKCHDFGWNADRVCWQEQAVDLEIHFEDGLSPFHYHWTDSVITSSERHYDPINVIENPFMNLCKNWSRTDEIILLVHENYPAYRWIVNVTRCGEAFFCKGNQAIDSVANIWDIPVPPQRHPSKPIQSY